MVSFSLSQWLRSTKSLVVRLKPRQPRPSQVLRVEGLEDRTLLTVPVAVDDSYVIAEDGTLNGSTVLENDTDEEDDTIDQAELVADVQHGSLTLNGDGTFQYVPAPNYFGTDTFTYRAKDSTNNETSENIATVTITVTSVNDTPIAAFDSFSVTQNSTFNGSVIAADVELDELTYSVVAEPEHGTLVINEDGTFTYTPDEDYLGPDSFTFKANDGTGDSNTATVTITVTEPNLAPIASPATFTIDEDGSLTDAVNAADAENDDLIYSLVADAAHGELVFNADGTFTYTPDEDYFGTDTFTFKANDGNSDSNIATITINVTSVNDVPVAVAANLSTDEDEVLAGSLVGTDADSDELIYSAGTIEAAHGTVVINADGTFTYTPDDNYFGTDSFSFKVNDGTVDSPEATVNITITSVNDAPVASPATFALDEDDSLSDTVAAADTEGDDLIYSLVDDVVHGTLVFNDDGTFTYTPDADFFGTDTFTFKANDGTDDSNTATVTLNVAGINDLPVAAAASYTTSKNVIFQGNLVASDVDGDELNYSPGMIEAQNGTVVINADGTFTYTPDADYFGPDSFSFIANDGTGDSVEATITLTVANNVLPVVTSSLVETDEDTPYDGQLTATDDDLDDLTFYLGQVAPEHGVVVINEDGSYTYTPDEDFFGNDYFSFYANDGVGNSVEAVITVTVNAVNDAPTATAAAVSTAEDVELEGQLAGVDPDPGPLTYLPGDVEPQHGSVVINEDGTYTYTPNLNYFGSDTFSFKVSDGLVESAEATVTITITSVNDAPVVVNANFSVAEDGTLSDTIPAGTDVETDAEDLTYSLVDNVDNGTLVFNADGTFTYTPNANYFGTDTFTYKSNDGTDDSNVATVTITVNSINDIPVATTTAVTATEDQVLEGQLTGTDVENSPLTYALGNTLPSNGEVVINEDGTFSYTPDADFFGTDTFSYVVSDGDLVSLPVTVTVTVTGVNDAPVVVNGTGDATEDTVFQGSVSSLGSDVDADELNYAVVEGPTNGVLSLNPDGTFSYTPNANFFGTDTFTFKVNDGTVDGNTATFTIAVAGVDDDLELTLPSAAAMVARNNKVVNIDPAASLTDIDTDVNYSGAQLRVAVLTGNTDLDNKKGRVTLKIKNQGTGAGNVKIKGSKLYFDGDNKTVMATFSGGKKGQPLVINFTAAATPAAVNAILKQLTMQASKKASTGTRTIGYEVTADGQTVTGTQSAIVL